MFFPPTATFLTTINVVLWDDICQNLVHIIGNVTTCSTKVLFSHGKYFRALPGVLLLAGRHYMPVPTDIPRRVGKKITLNALLSTCYFSQ